MQFSDAMIIRTIIPASCVFIAYTCLPRVLY